MPMTGVNEGDRLLAERVVIEAMNITPKRVIRRTGAHRGQRAIAERNVECVIVRKMVLAKVGE